MIVTTAEACRSARARTAQMLGAMSTRRSFCIRRAGQVRVTVAGARIAVMRVTVCPLRMAPVVVAASVSVRVPGIVEGRLTSSVGALLTRCAGPLRRLIRRSSTMTVTTSATCSVIMIVRKTSTSSATCMRQLGCCLLDLINVLFQCIRDFG